MRRSWCWIFAFVVAISVFPVLQYSGAQGTKTAPPQGEPSKGRIIPVVVLKPGETKEILLSTSCALITRGRGLLVGEMKGGRFRNEGKTWKRDGVTVAFPPMPDEPRDSPWAKQGINLFLVRVSAAEDARPDLIDLHVADETCSGTCDTDFRVLVRGG